MQTTSLEIPSDTQYVGIMYELKVFSTVKLYRCLFLLLIFLQLYNHNTERKCATIHFASNLFAFKIKTFLHQVV